MLEAYRGGELSDERKGGWDRGGGVTEDLHAHQPSDWLASVLEGA